MVKKFKLKKIGLLIYPKMFQNNDGENINGPSLIKVPSWITSPLARYYLYFSHHNGKYIRMAFSNFIEGPYSIFQNGVLNLKNSLGSRHIASPDLHIDNKNKKIIMYYHTFYNDFQYTFKSLSSDGINFVSNNKKLGYYYFRVFKYNNQLYSIAKGRKNYGIIYKYLNETWKIINDRFIKNLRHTGVLVEANNVFIFYSLIGEIQESIYCSVLDLSNYNLNNTYKIIKPSLEYEGSNILKKKSIEGIELNYVNQVRDPAIFINKSEKYLLYSVSGEKGIALGKLI